MTARRAWASVMLPHPEGLGFGGSTRTPQPATRPAPSTASFVALTVDRLGRVDQGQGKVPFVGPAGAGA